MRRVALAMLVVAFGCGEQEPANPPQPQSTTAASADTATTNTAAESKTITARVLVVDLDGNPLPGMMPIATRNPNAFDPPVATGGPTDAEGRSAVVLPPGERLHVRAWDPELKWFANNFYEVFEGAGDTTQEMRIAMARAATLDGVVLAPDASPVPAGAELRLILAHPVHGPWWPDRALVQEHGAVHFPALPPGSFPARFEVVGIGAIETAPIDLRPGAPATFGAITLIP